MTDSIADVLALARAGAVAPARAAFAAAGLDRRTDDPSALTLKGRLLKDAAGAAAGATRSALLAEAAKAYEAAARLSPATYPLINAATLSLLGGRRDRAARLAVETLELLDSGLHEPDTPYWLGATRAEALLLLDRKDAAEAALRDAVTGTPRAWEDHAVTIRQFRMILAEQGRAAEWLDAWRPPSPVHFAGPIGVAAGDTQLEAAIEAAIATTGAGIAVGALAAGFDIVVAELFVRRGAELHVVLPAAPELFVEASVMPAGYAWRARFEALLAAAARVDILDLSGGLSMGATTLAEEMALGCAVRSARQFGVDAVMLRLAGSEADSDASARAGLRRLDVRGGVVGSGGLPLGPPNRPVALLGCRHAAAERLGALTGSAVQITPWGVFTMLDRLDAAAETAVALVAGADADIHVVLDYIPACPDGSADVAALDALLAIPARGYPIATRSASLALEAKGAPFRLALAGASSGLAGSVEFFSLWNGAA
ncbi:hypothetical protein Q9Q95_17920 [Sphingomonas sp. DG1-23]|uniref:tetratricopeptide repeat-containing protein n=1 Tax=Sphingomonas sp. DG1-23 TaxID=3068316 RepID=UPI00273E8B10|nr:tetratricopeptide repeat-containing protein [Sphingomonas sp. DG1-23]MDP5280808.1 hypothetical protein [Sphingomonas sp. DG1-23]